MNRKLLTAVFCFFIALTIFSLKIPFFWDGTFFSALSLHYYESGFRGFSAPPSFDTGGFPMYSVYLALAWKVAGKSLVSSHIAMLPILFGIAWEYMKLAKRWLNGPALVFAMLLLVIEPVFITQSILMGYDTLLAYFFLLSLNALLDEKRILFSAALILLCMASVRGMMLGTALFLIDLTVNRKKSYRFNMSYLPAAVVLVLWMLYHHSRTGWFIFSPERTDNAEAFAGPGMILRQLAYIAWKNLDIGRITLWLTLAVGYYYFLRKHEEGKRLLKIILIPLFTLSLFMCLIKNPIAPKYFMTVFLLLNIGVAVVIQQLEKKNVRIMIFLSVAVSLICGNFILYPQRYGNAWDSTLKILPYFKLKAEMDQYTGSMLLKENLTPDAIGTQFPLNAIRDHEFVLRAGGNAIYADIGEMPAESFRYFLFSNVINSNRIDDLNEIRRTWVREKELQSGQIVMILFRNPSFSQSFPNDLTSKDPGKAAAQSPGRAMP